MTEEVVASSPLEYLINGAKVCGWNTEAWRLVCIASHTPLTHHSISQFLQILFALSPLIVLAYILFSAFESPEAEALKRRKKGDFELEGHGE